LFKYRIEFFLGDFVVRHYFFDVKLDMFEQIVKLVDGFPLKQQRFFLLQVLLSREEPFGLAQLEMFL
jgi:hypothetical protein